MENDERFSQRLVLRIDWADMDLFGHVNNVAYFRYVQQARVAYWERVGLAQLHTEQNVGATLAETGCRFLRPLHYPGAVLVYTRLDFIKTSAFGLFHQLRTEADEIAAEAHDVVVVFDYNRQEKTAIPDEIRRAIQTLENRTT